MTQINIKYNNNNTFYRAQKLSNSKYIFYCATRASDMLRLNKLQHQAAITSTKSQ